ncbi:Glucose/arabinose dehydrogenase, beta-propeller fold [Cohaesibacter sp. ES.047]|uniref:PQQ-dependent sugar dehydrogenase n=1 Tax=Cohaesibacter sp. ES.047 TaxID=1798205 RepID=UPI000BB74D22|nr:PQQ-dependent sugar dehydrogenase [Cohaesibacter sp. ES.047]SNY90200.1 Glucose/arabinose dehydrogenase, beta-propeller fold [Cohaesibacter sp. ES.047]
MNATVTKSLLAVGLIAGFGSIAIPAQAQTFNTRPPNADNQSPAFKGQTRAPILSDGVTLKREVIANGLDHPWGMDQLPEGRWLVTERPGQMRIIAPDGTKSDRIGGLPEVDARGQGGLLDVTVKDDFKQTRRVWWSYAEPRGNGTNATAVATGTLSEDDSRMENVKVIFQQQPPWRSTYHFGSRLVFDESDALFVTTGERSLEEPRQLAQDVGTTIGKVVRINPMGGPADGNPEIDGGLPEIWSYGHRNLQAAALDADGKLWTVEHGPKGGDELNQPKPGLNYGWPVISYGINYSGAPVGEGLTAKDGMEQPVYYWDPVIAPSGMVFYDGDMFPAWRGDALIGGLASRALVRLEIEDGKVVGEARYIEGNARIRDVDVDASDGSIIVLTDADRGALIKLTPR